MEHDLLLNLLTPKTQSKEKIMGNETLLKQETPPQIKSDEPQYPECILLIVLLVFLLFCGIAGKGQRR